MKPGIVTTKDGSHTLYSAKLDEHYHSLFGAVTESMHVFIDAGLKAAGRTAANAGNLAIGAGQVKVRQRRGAPGGRFGNTRVERGNLL